MHAYFIKKNEIRRFFESLLDRFDLYIINQKNKDLFWVKFDPQNVDDTIINKHRPAEPLKGFIFKSKEKVLDSLESPKSKKKPVAIIGVKACDLYSLKILDYIFMQGDFKDPFYIDARREALIVSSDCTSFKDVCFCLGVGIEPFPKESFDLNFSELEEGFIITAGSEKGEKVLKGLKASLNDVRESQWELLRRKNKSFLEKLRLSIDSMRLPPSGSLKDRVRLGFKSDVWGKFAERCVECGACNTVCPTCHCFLLVDESSGDKYQRLKIWDSCLLKRFAKVAGGANPRKHLKERLRNRFIKKFDFFHEVLGTYACTGCGRCIEACLGDIDLREVLKELKS